MCRTATLLVILMAATLVGIPATASAQSMDAWVGTWTLNIAKSKYDPGPAPQPPTSNTTILEMVNGVMRITTDTVNAQGQRNQVVRYAHFNNMPQPQVGSNPNAGATTHAYTWVDAQTYQWVTRVNGKVTTTTRLVLSPDRRTQTLTTTGTNAQGQKVNTVTIFEKQ